jgi:hypothetical protein
MTKPRALLALVALLLFAITTVACADDAGPGGPGEGEGEGEGEPGSDTMELVGPPSIIEITPVLSAGMAMTVRADGRAAFVYVELGTTTVECVLFGGETVEEDTHDIKVADELADGTFRIRTVASPPPLAGDGVDIAVDPVSDALVVAFQGGAPAAGVCGASDLVVAVESGDTFILTTVAESAGDAAGDCRDGLDPLCQQGDFVGRFPALTIADGAMALAYTDNHFGFGETDIFESDLELVRGTSASAITGINSINTETGAGYFTSTAITPDGRTLIAHQLIGNNIQDEGVYANVEQSDGTFLETMVIENPEVSGRVAAGASDSGLYVVLREDGTDQLFMFHSVDDGATWPFVAVEQLSVTGLNPQLGFLSDGTVVVAYGHCRDVDDGTELCSPSEDGVRVAWRDVGATQFNKATFLGDDEDSEGLNVDMAISADDIITTLSFNASQSQAMIHRIQRVTE